MDSSGKWFGSSEANYLISVSDIMMGLLYVFIIMIVSYAFMIQQTEKKMVEAIIDAEEAKEDFLASDEKGKELKKKMEKAIREAEIAQMNFLASDKKTKRLEIEMAKAIKEAEEAKRASVLSKEKNKKLERETFAALNRLKDSRVSRTKLLKDIQADLSIENIHIIVDENSGILRLPEGIVTFKHGESEFQDENSEENLLKVAKALNHVIPCYLPGYRTHDCKEAPSHYLEAVFIEGHTDTTGAEDINWRLSTQRALKAFWVITEAEPDLKNYTNELEQPLLSISGYGKLRPLPRNKNMDDETYHKINRRIDFRFIMTPPENYQVERNESGWSIERKELN